VASCVWRVSREPCCEGERASLSSVYLEFCQVWSVKSGAIPGQIEAPGSILHILILNQTKQRTRRVHKNEAKRGILEGGLGADSNISEW